MVDRVYRAGLPALRKKLEKLREDFLDADPRTDWTQLRIEPLLAHVRSLERIIESAAFSREHARLRRGVVMFHSDLVYLRTNVQALEKVLESERAARARTSTRVGSRKG